MFTLIFGSSYNILEAVNTLGQFFFYWSAGGGGGGLVIRYVPVLFVCVKLSTIFSRIYFK